MRQIEMKRRRSVPAILVAAAAIGAAGCGDNLFDTDNPPEVETFLTDRESVLEGDALVFLLEASGPRTIDRLRVVLSGGVEADTTVLLENRADTEVSAQLVWTMPSGTGPDPEDPNQGYTPDVTARAYAIDVMPDTTSDPATLTFQLLDNTPPEVSATVTPAQVGSGDPIQIEVTATDNRGVFVVGARVSDGMAFDTTLADTLDAPALSVTRTLEMTVPPLDDGTLEVAPFALDGREQLPTAADTIRVSLSDKNGPTFLALETRPDSTVPLGDSVQVRVRLRDPAGIRRVSFVGLAYRGDPAQGTDSVVQRFATKTIDLPRPTEPGALPVVDTLLPYLLPTINDQPEQVEIVVSAEDGLGNVSQTSRFMFVGGPNVSITAPPDSFSVGIGSEFNARISIFDGAGIDSAKLVLSGAIVDTLSLQLPPGTSEEFEVLQTVQMSEAGEVFLQAWAWNTDEVAGQSRRVLVNVLTEPPADEEPPELSLTTERLVPPGTEGRVELSDEIRAVVTAIDGLSGLERMGLLIVASRAGIQDTIRVDTTLDSSRSQETFTFQVPVESLYARIGLTDPAEVDSILPEDLDLRIHAFAADAQGQIACAVVDEEQRSCTPGGYSPDEFYAATGSPGSLLELDVVRGRTLQLRDAGSRIADLEVDTLNERLYMSDIAQNLVWGLPVLPDLGDMAQDEQFAVKVGSQPWGLFIGERGEDERMLIVANSGGTNLSFVDIAPADTAAVAEIDQVRLFTPNAVLSEVSITSDEQGFTRFVVEPPYDFSDRPQFIAQDSLRRIVYANVPTEAAGLTALRYILTDPDPSTEQDNPEVRFLIHSDMVNPDNPEQLAIANVDAVLVRALEGAPDSIAFLGHVPGYPDSEIITDFYAQPESAIQELNNQIRSIMQARGLGAEAELYTGFLSRGSWNLGAVGLADTTYVVASGDRGRIAIGEGAASPTGRILMWFAEPSVATSASIQIRDLVNNASEQVLGVGLNNDGSLGVARGVEATYFFTTDLREQGRVVPTDYNGGAGAAFHPEHDTRFAGGDEDPDGGGFAFTGTSQRSVEVTNTFHFYEVADIQIRDNIVGPLQVGPPLRAERNCTGDGCVVAKVYGITDSGGVVVLNVRRRDLLDN